MAKILAVLYDDPVSGYPTTYTRDLIPTISSYPDGQTAPSPRQIDFIPGQLLGSVTGELGLRSFLEGAGHTLIVTSDKDGPESVFERELLDADVVISLSTLLACVLDRRADRQGAQSQVGHHRRHWLRSRRPRGGHRTETHRGGSDLFQQHQRR